MVLAAFESQKRISATIAFVLLCFHYLTHRLGIVVVKSSTVKERTDMIDVEKQQGIIKLLLLT